MPLLRVIRGEIEVPAEVTPFTPAHVLVELEDISRADAPSEVVARQELTPGQLRGRDVIPFALEVPSDALDERHLYSVRVHVDLTGSHEVRIGDYITTRTYPVLTRGHGTELRASLKRVG